MAGPCGKIHYGIRPGIHCSGELLQFLIGVAMAQGRANIGVDLCFKPFSDAPRQKITLYVFGYNDFSFSQQATQRLGDTPSAFAT
jgi:hypothetical protein